MTERPLSHREKQVRRHNVATVIAALTFAIALLAADGLIPALQPFRLPAYLVMLVAIIVMFRTRNADEYITAIWRSATNVAFVALVALLVFGPMLEGFWDGLTGNERGQELTAAAFGMPLALLSFFLGNLWARLRGTI